MSSSPQPPAREPSPTPDAARAAPGASGRPLRAHAQRNREKLLEAARTAFGSTGDGVPLESIARDAGVGIGTLYRHFPTREALVEAVYAAELDEVTGSVAPLLARNPPDIALREWMHGYARFIVTKRSMLPTLRAGWGSGRIATPATRRRVTEAIGTFLSAGVETGVFRDDVAPDDVTILILGTFLATDADDSDEHTARLLDLVGDSLRRRR